MNSEEIPDYDPSSVSLEETTISAIQEIIIRWGRKHYRPFPWRDPDQPWHGLVAEILLQRTKVANVVNVYEHFLIRFPTIETLASSSVHEIEEIIYPLGLRWRAVYLKQLGERLIELGGYIPTALEQVRALPGVGDYIAAAWLSFHAGKRGIIIDANIVRWLCRLVDRTWNGETRRKQWLKELAEQFTPEDDFKVYNYAALDFTMEICVPHPKCDDCPLGAELCRYRHRVLVEES